MAARAGAGRRRGGVGSVSFIRHVCVLSTLLSARRLFMSASLRLDGSNDTLAEEQLKEKSNSWKVCLPKGAFPHQGAGGAPSGRFSQSGDGSGWFLLT